MKDTRPIEMQVAELTPEQQDTCVKVYARSIVVAIVAAALMLAALGGFIVGNKVLEAEVDAISAQRRDSLSIWDFSAYAEYSKDWSEAMDRWETFADIGYIVLLVWIVLCVAAYGVFFMFLKKKYPYYTEKKATYIRKMCKAAPPVPPVQYPPAQP